MKKLLLIIVLSVFAYGSYAQQWKKNLPQDKKDVTFFDYQKAFNNYWESYNVVGGFYLDEAGNKVKAPGWKQFKRWEYFWKSRVDNVTGEFPNKSAWEAWEDYLVNNPSSKSLKGDWEPLGPSNLHAYDDGAMQESGTGRLNCMTFDPIDDNHFWVGAPSGGVWESSDNGITWTCLTDALPIIGVSDVAIPSNYNVTTNPVIYIGSGDRDAVDDPSIGVLKSTDGGTTWVTTGLTFNASSNVRIGRVICSPYDSNTIIAATSVGVYKSIDAGVSWSMMQSGFFIDMELIPTTNTLVATTMGLGSKAFMSSNMGNSWTEVFTGDAVNEYRCDVAVTAANTSIVYLITDYALTDALYAIYKSTNGGASFTKVYDGLTSNNLYGWSATNNEGAGGQGWYDVAFAVSNTDANVVYVGGVNAYISTNGAVSFAICSGWRDGLGCDVVHADHHNAYFRPSDNRMYDVNDGGVYYCDNVTAGGTSVWTSITNGIVTGQLYDIGVSQVTEGTIVAGFQDNGTKLLTPTSYPNWNIVKSGDGMCCAIDPTNTATQWGTYVELQVDQTVNTWGSMSSIRNGGTAQWAGPLEADPRGGATVYIGTSAVEMYPSASKNDSKPGGGGGRTAWENLSGTLDGTNFLSALDVFNDGQNKVIWTASPIGCWKSDNTGHNFTLVSGLPGNLVTDIAIDEDDYNHVYVCFGGYDAINVYETTNGGTSWTDVSTGLPIAPTGAIVINEQNTTNHEVYVGTDAGVFVKLGTAPWQLYTNGMPFVSITDLEFYYNVNPANSYLCAATYGRGIWKTDCYTPPTLDASISAVVEPQTEYCDPGTIVPTFKLSNIGTNALTSADIEYSIDGGTVISQSWTGSLAQGVSVDITFPVISLAIGAHSITASLSNPNGNSVDENSDNDSKQKDYALWDHNMPYTQNFDDFPSGGNTNNYDGGIVLLSKCWVNESNDDIDWSVTSGASPSGSTGPSGDHTSGEGVYIYTESSGSNNAKVAKVSSPVIDLTSYTNSVVTFWYHMYSVDNTMGSLTIDLFYNGTQYNNVSVNWNGTVATSISGDQGDAWYQATVDISAADGASDFVFTFDALTGSDYEGDMAIDDFSVTGSAIDELKGTTSIDDLENSNLFSVYPNPSNGRFNITTKNVEIESEIEIHDATGKLVYKGRIENSDTHAVDLKDSPAGIYFIKVQSGNTIVNKKVVIE